MMEWVRASPPPRESAMAACRGRAGRECGRDKDGEEEARDKTFLGVVVSREASVRPEVLIVSLLLLHSPNFTSPSTLLLPAVPLNFLRKLPTATSYIHTSSFFLFFFLVRIPVVARPCPSGGKPLPQPSAVGAGLCPCIARLVTGPAQPWPPSRGAGLYP